MPSRLLPGLWIFALVLGLVSCDEKNSDFSHDFEFNDSSGNSGYSKEHKLDDPATVFAFTVRVEGTDAILPEDVQVSANLSCQSGPVFSGSFPVQLLPGGYHQLNGSFSRAATECVDAETGQNGIAVWTVSVTRLNTTVGMKVIVLGGS